MSTITKFRTVEYKECPISIRLSDNMISLTDMWKAQGSPDARRPNDWLALPETKKLLPVLASEVNAEISGIYETRKGKGGGTIGLPKLAIAYAEYLSPEFHSWALGALVERIEEDADPELAINRGRERAVKTWRRQGKGNDWIDTRAKGVEQRRQFTDTLKEHGVNQPWQFGVCTNEIYKPILGSSAKEVKKERNLPEKANLRDSLDEVENAAVTLAEALTRKKLGSNNDSGFKVCRTACTESANQVKKALN